jgi:hypothetical protein
MYNLPEHRSGPINEMFTKIKFNIKAHIGAETFYSKDTSTVKFAILRLSKLVP